MLFSFVGCNNTEKQNSEAKELLQKVLDKEQNFSYKCLVFDKVTEESLKEFRFHTEYSALNSFVSQAYTYIDFDSDGIEELLIVDTELQFFLILRYDGEKVVGYIVDDNIDLQNVKTNGTFLTVSYIFDDDSKIIGKEFYVSEVEFNGLDCQVNTLASQNHEDNIYKIGEQSATEDEVEKYFEDWDKTTTKISWVTIK